MDSLDNICDWLMNDLVYRAPEDWAGRRTQIKAALERAYQLGQLNPEADEDG